MRSHVTGYVVSLQFEHIKPIDQISVGTLSPSKYPMMLWRLEAYSSVVEKYWWTMKWLQNHSCPTSTLSLNLPQYLRWSSSNVFQTKRNWKKTASVNSDIRHHSYVQLVTFVIFRLISFISVRLARIAHSAKVVLCAHTPFSPPYPDPPVLSPPSPASG